MPASDFSPPSATVSASALSGCTCFKLRSLSRRITQLYDQAMAPCGLKVTQYSLLAHARRRDGALPPSVSALADAMFTERTTLTRNLRPLVEAGYLRIENGGDARTRAVRVTAAGEAAFQAARPLWRGAQARVNALVGAERLGALHGLIEELLSVVDGIGPAGAAPARRG
jgi:DNA-binding MarR family transcriptional regulator